MRQQLPYIPTQHHPMWRCVRPPPPGVQVEDMRDGHEAMIAEARGSSSASPGRVRLIHERIAGAFDKAGGGKTGLALPVGFRSRSNQGSRNLGAIHPTEPCQRLTKSSTNLFPRQMSPAQHLTPERRRSGRARQKGRAFPGAVSPTALPRSRRPQNRRCNRHSEGSRRFSCSWSS